MAHYALLDENNIVTAVITGKNEDEQRDGVDVNWEEWYRDFHGAADCKRTSYNTNANVHANGGTPFRGNYAGLGYTYDTSNNVFLSPKPYPSWIIDTSTWSWKAPVEHPEGEAKDWDEVAGAWVDFP